MKHGWIRTLTAGAMLCTVVPGASVAMAADELQLHDLAGAVGLAEVNETFHAAPADFDADGDQDVLIGYHDQGAKLWRNDGGAFTRVSPTAWPKRDRHDCAWADANVDGRLDVHCTVGRTGSNQVKGSARDNELWLQQANGTFVDHGTAWGIGDPYGRGRATTFLDVNGDAYPDLFVGNELPRPDDADAGANGENKLFINDGGLRMIPAPGMGLNRFDGADCALLLDYDADGWDDLYLCGSTRAVLYRNQAGAGFAETTEAAGVDGARKLDADLGDVDGDGDQDLVSVSAAGVQYQLLDAGRFGAATTVLATADGRETALGDADADRDLDIFVLLGNPTANANDLLLLNDRLAFTPISGPPTSGQADAAVTLDPDGDGAAEFLALNGQDVPGPVQLLALRSGPPPDPQPTANLLANAGFELDADGDGRPDAWTENARFARSSKLVRTGAWAGRHGATDNAGYKVQQQVPVAASESYRLSGWVNVPPTVDSFKLLFKVQWRGPSGSLGTETAGTVQAATSGWQAVDRLLTAPPGATAVRVMMVVKSLSAEIFIDDLMLSPVE